MTVELLAPVTARSANQWAFALSNFKPDRLSVWSPCDADLRNRPLRGAAPVDAVTVSDSDVVVLAPPNGRHVRGEISLVEFDHPEHALYVIGPDGEHLTADRIEVDYQAVYVPTDTVDEMYSWVVWAVVAWDRRMKRG